MSTAKNPWGPWVKSSANPVLSRNQEFFGAGHNAFFTSKEGELLTSFHIQTNPDKPSGDRTTVIGKVKFVEEKTGKETRLVVLSYLQRGGSPTMNDRLLATLCGAKAVELLVSGEANKAIGTVKGEIVSFDLEEALKMPSTFNEEMYKLIDVLSK
jgi:6-phosphofructokinase